MVVNPNEGRKIEPPQNVNDEGFHPESGSKSAGVKAGGNMTNILLLFAVLVVSVLFTIYQTGSKVSMADETNNFKGVTQSIANVQSDLKAVQSNLTTTTNNLSQLTSKVDGLNSSISSATNAANQANTQAQSVNSSVSALQSKVSDLTNQVSQLNQLNSKIADLQSKVDTVTTAQKSDASAITVLQTSGAQLSNTQNGALITQTPNGQVSALVQANYFTGASGIAFPAVAPSSSGSQSFTFQLNNQTGKPLTSVTLALAIQTEDSLGNLKTIDPTWAVNVASGNAGLIWTSQATGTPYVLGWVSNANVSGFTSMFGTMTVPVGISTYTQTITLSCGTVGAPSLLLAPMIKVVGFTN